MKLPTWLRKVSEKSFNMDHYNRNKIIGEVNGNTILDFNDNEENGMENYIRDRVVLVNLSDLFWDSRKLNYDALDLYKATRQDMISALLKDAEELIGLYNLEDVKAEDLVEDYMDRR